MGFLLVDRLGGLLDNDMRTQTDRKVDSNLGVDLDVGSSKWV